MKEEYLHYLWQHKRLPFHSFKTTDGESIDIINTGWLNSDSGPDFFSGAVNIQGITWSGNIEIHIRSSDWYKHQHHKDEAYNNVILHVVLIHDQDVFIGNRKIPTVGLKAFIDKKHFQNYRALLNKKNERPCKPSLASSNVLHEQIENALFQRLSRKVAEITALKENFHFTHFAVFHLLFAQAFGGRANKEAFRELSMRLDIRLILKEQWNLLAVESMVFGIAGFLNDDISMDHYQRKLKREWSHLKRKYALKEMNKTAWKFSGMRPPSFPTVKLSQYARIITKLNDNFHPACSPNKMVETFYTQLDLLPHHYWDSHYDFNKPAKKSNGQLSKQFKRHLAINGLAPFLFYQGQKLNDFKYIDIAYAILELISAENNFIIKKWKEDGVHPKNANESQGLIELNNEFCTFRRCLNCKIGQELLAS
jgi:hypothetical protein